MRVTVVLIVDTRDEADMVKCYDHRVLDYQPSCRLGKSESLPRRLQVPVNCKLRNTPLKIFYMSLSPLCVSIAKIFSSFSRCAFEAIIGSGSGFCANIAHPVILMSNVVNRGANLTGLASGLLASSTHEGRHGTRGV